MSTQLMNVMTLIFVTSSIWAAPSDGLKTATAVSCQSLVAGTSNPETSPELKSFKKAAQADPRFENFLEDYDQRAFEVVRNLSAKKPELEVALKNWFGNLEKQNSLSVTEFTTLQLVLKSDFMKSLSSEDLQADMKNTLSHTWFKLTGQKKDAAKLVNAQLPEKILKLQDIRIRRFHELATKINGSSLQVEPGVTGKIVNKMAPLALLTFGLADTGGDLLSGALVGYSVSLAAEYWIHRWVMHSGKSFENLPWYLRINKKTQKYVNLARLHFSHHQELNARNYKLPEGAGDLDSAYVKYQLTPKLEENGMTPDRIAVYVEETRHATVMEKDGWKSAHLIMAPAAVGLSAFVAQDPVVASMTAALMAYSFILHVNYVHPKMHDSRAHIAESASKIDQWFTETAYFRYIARYHYMHHARPNTNLSILPLGWDSLLKTESYLPLSRLLKMMDDDLVY